MTHTPGPWYWDVRPSTKTFRLVTPHGGYMIVMDFSRWGMQGAQPRFSDRNGERRGGIMEDGSKIDLSKNPDACLIAAAPDLLEACKEAQGWVGMIQQELDAISDGGLQSSEYTPEELCGQTIPLLAKLAAAIAKAEPTP